MDDRSCELAMAVFVEHPFNLRNSDTVVVKIRAYNQIGYGAISDPTEWIPSILTPAKVLGVKMDDSLTLKWEKGSNYRRHTYEVWDDMVMLS